jgi:hypothetical protein
MVGTDKRLQMGIQVFVIATLLWGRLVITLCFLLKWTTPISIIVFGLLVQGMAPRLGIRIVVSFWLVCTRILTVVAISSI